MIAEKRISYINNAILMLIVLFSAFRATIFPSLLGLGDRVFLILIPALGITFCIYFVKATATEKKEFLKENAIVIVYFLIRGICWVVNGLDHYILGSLVYEVTFLILICRWTAGNFETAKKICNMFILFNLLMNVMSLINMLFNMVGVDTFEYLAKVHENPDYLTLSPWAALYLNPNNAGIMTAMALLLFICFKNKRSSKGIIRICYIIFTFFMMYNYGCRSAIVGFLAVAIMWLIIELFKYNKKYAMLISFLVIAMGNSILLGVLIIDKMQVPEVINQINYVSSGRYVIWKDSCGATIAGDYLLFGQGSNETELENRNAYLKERWVRDGYGEDAFIPTNLGIHNGFLGLIFNGGILCFICFIIIMWQKIRRMPMALNGHWYMIIIFSLVVNNFEALLIMNRSYVCFLMMIVLTMSDEKIDILSNKDEKLEEEES